MPHNPVGLLPEPQRIDHAPYGHMTSMACAVLLLRDPAGEVRTTLGVEVLAEPQAVLPEGVRCEVRSHDECALPAELAFGLLGLKPPLGVRGRQRVPVFHQGLDLGVVLERVPHHADGTDGLIVHGGLDA